MEAGLDGFEPVGLVVLDREQEVAVGVEDRLGQGPLRKQSIGGEETEKRVVLQQLREAGLQRLRCGRLAAGPRELGQAETHLVREDGEHVDRITVGVVPLLAGLAVGGSHDSPGGVR